MRFIVSLFLDDDGNLSSDRARQILASNLQAGRFARSVGLTAFVNGIVALIGLGTGVIAARELGPGPRGELAVVQVWPPFVASLSMVGMADSVVYFASQNPDASLSILRKAAAIATVGAILLSVASWFTLPMLLDKQSEEIIRVARLAVPGMAFAYIIAGLPHQLLRPTGKWLAWNALRPLPPLVWFAVLFFALFAQSATDSAYLGKLFIMSAIVSAVPVLVISLYLLRSLRDDATITSSSLVRYGIPSAMNNLPQTLNASADRLVVASMLTSNANGNYAVSAAWGAIAGPIVQAVSPVSFPHISGLPNDKARFAFLRRLLPRAAFFFAAVSIVAVIVTPFILPHLFGHEFESAIVPGMILIIAGGANALNSVLQSGLQGLGSPVSALYANILGFATAGLMLFLLVPAHGIVGAAVASLFGSVAATIALSAALYFRWRKAR